MPVHDAVALAERDLHQPSATRPTGAFPGVGLVDRAVRRAKEPLAAIVEEAIGLEVQLHCHVAASIQIGMRYTLKADSEGAAGLPRMHHVERYGAAAFDQIGSIAEWDAIGHAGIVMRSREAIP